MHSNSWITCDDFETDAYMLAFNYAEGTSVSQHSRMMMGYGSALRRHGEVWFSSLSKQFVMK